ncbi:MAG: phospho-sugar mutase [Deltaproteobacteria bacterium]|nr:phospho-sugar mutase [Deltaproteobacteria bacterium]
MLAQASARRSEAAVHSMTPDAPGSDDELFRAAEAWIADDPDPTTRAELRALIDAGDAAALAERFAGPMEFGTAGLRGLLGAGPARMNLATISRAAAGLARQLIADLPDARQRGVLVGRDGRRMSPELARRTAEILAGHGVRVHWLEHPSPTPLCAFAHRHLRSAAAAVVTASHNPPEYNGFKVYGLAGDQIVPPQDHRVAELMVAAGPVAELPRAEFDAAVAADLVHLAGPEVEGAYLGALDLQCVGVQPPPAEPTIVLTALHGVGARLVEAALRRRGMTRLVQVAEQAEPDGEFPTVRFPNPEEPGALDLALRYGRDAKADLVLANDPDTDRLCVAVADAASESGFRVLTGNEVGVLLADWLLTRRAENGTLPERPFVATTIVSTTMLQRIAAAHGATCAETLTGFKWIWEAALAHDPTGESFVFGFEEALGYCVGTVVRDKDGIGAAQAVAECAAASMARGRTLLDRLDELTREHGAHVTRQVSTVLPGLDGKAKMAAVLARMRAEPPEHIAGVAVARARDLGGPDAEASGLPRSDVLTWWLADGTRLILRPSGTEPKLKSYIEAREPVAADETVAAAVARANARVDTLAQWIAQAVSGGGNGR